jgi:hypothetical protein
MIRKISWFLAATAPTLPYGLKLATLLPVTTHAITACCCLLPTCRLPALQRVVAKYRAAYGVRSKIEVLASSGEGDDLAGLPREVVAAVSMWRQQVSRLALLRVWCMVLSDTCG